MHYVLRLPEVKKRTGLSRSTIYERIANNAFPKQISLGEKAVGWIEADVQCWIEAQITASQTILKDESRANG